MRPAEVGDEVKGHSGVSSLTAHAIGCSTFLRKNSQDVALSRDPTRKLDFQSVQASFQAALVHWDSDGKTVCRVNDRKEVLEHVNGRIRGDLLRYKLKVRCLHQPIQSSPSCVQHVVRKRRHGG